ncbi:Fe-S cluster assembly protein NifU [Amphritea pacifica]|uniref:Nitrogen fixation protein NifU n=1 Tax=Amphritea pacifica TaxID=2811233 RepID=A0ABS2W7A4_9GAMM|nr:Fe-S cluster assembly protein NifU [Amphritea pacifica]MBN0987588.1 Fe-S cluster assembly protein NifU [Amphritea pacifica]MBN1007433.1 Fe-S cluster assembly protein NifU [Amphritea pacifica]
MWDYSEKVKEHFYNPKNAGAAENANATGEVGSLSCGDALRLTLKVDPDTEIILDAGFQTFGCGSAIASSSALTEIIKGMTLDQALQVSNQDIADFLDGLPPEKMHCSVMGREALQAAVADYRGEVWSDDHEEGALVCKCFAIDEVMIEDTIRANSLTTVEEVTNYTKAGGGCSACHEGIENILSRVMAESGKEFVAGGVGSAVPAKAPEAPVEAAPKTDIKRISTIMRVLEAVRPRLQADGGDCELMDIDGNTIYVNLTGACMGCQMASMTLGGIQQQLIEELGEFVRLVQVEKKADQLVGIGG